MTSILAVIIVFGLLIAFHELGHFLVAKALGIGVKTFSLGFPPKLLSITRGQTEYRISMVPLGGYVQLVGESREDDVPEGFTPRQSFMRRPAWQRMLVVAAGPLFNFFLAIVLYWMVFVIGGMIHSLPIIGTVQDDSPAMAAGLQPGDRILTIDDQETQYWADIPKIVKRSEGQELHLVLERDAEQLTLRITPKLMVAKNIFGEEIRTLLIGIGPSSETVHVPMGLGEAAVQGVVQTWEMIGLMFKGLIKLIERVIPVDSVGGPIMIIQMVHEQASQGMLSLMWLTALISINLGIINLLPIPVLDGGHLIFYGYETIRGKPMSPKVQDLTIKLGLALLVLILILATYNDLQRNFPWLSVY